MRNIETDTHRNIYGNGIGQTSNPTGGVDQDNWRFNSDTQNYDYIGEPFDEIDSSPILPKQAMDQKIPIIREVAQVR